MGQTGYFHEGCAKSLYLVAIISQYLGKVHNMNHEKVHAIQHIQGVSKKGTLVIFCLISVLEVGFDFFTCVSESEF